MEYLFIEFASGGSRAAARHVTRFFLSTANHQVGGHGWSSFPFFFFFLRRRVYRTFLPLPRGNGVLSSSSQMGELFLFFRDKTKKTGT